MLYALQRTCSLVPGERMVLSVSRQLSGAMAGCSVPLIPLDHTWLRAWMHVETYVQHMRTAAAAAACIAAYAKCVCCPTWIQSVNKATVLMSMHAV
jgi:hypothetical protein